MENTFLISGGNPDDLVPSQPTEDPYFSTGTMSIESAIYELATSLHNVGLHVSPVSWTITKDETGLTLHYNWHKYIYCNNATDAQAHGTMKHKSLSRQKRDRERWLKYQEKRCHEKQCDNQRYTRVCETTKDYQNQLNVNAETFIPGNGICRGDLQLQQGIIVKSSEGKNPQMDYSPEQVSQGTVDLKSQPAIPLGVQQDFCNTNCDSHEVEDLPCSDCNNTDIEDLPFIDCYDTDVDEIFDPLITIKEDLKQTKQKLQSLRSKFKDKCTCVGGKNRPILKLQQKVADLEK